MPNKEEERRPASAPKTEDNAHYQYDKPHDEIVADVKSAVSSARTEWEKEHGPGTFDPVVWVGERLVRRSLYQHGDERTLREDLSYAWDAITQSHVRSKDYRRAIDITLSTATAMRGSNLVTLQPAALTFVDAVTETLGIPRPRGQATVDLLANPRRRQMFTAIYPHIARRLPR